MPAPHLHRPPSIPLRRTDKPKAPRRQEPTPQSTPMPDVLISYLEPALSKSFPPLRALQDLHDYSFLSALHAVHLELKPLWCRLLFLNTTKCRQITEAPAPYNLTGYIRHSDVIFHLNMQPDTIVARIINNNNSNDRQYSSSVCRHKVTA